jgi:hypothetical protein
MLTKHGRQRSIRVLLGCRRKKCLLGRDQFGARGIAIVGPSRTSAAFTDTAIWIDPGRLAKFAGSGLMRI